MAHYRTIPSEAGRPIETNKVLVVLSVTCGAALAALLANENLSQNQWAVTQAPTRPLHLDFSSTSRQMEPREYVQMLPPQQQSTRQTQNTRAPRREASWALATTALGSVAVFLGLYMRNRSPTLDLVEVKLQDPIALFATTGKVELGSTLEDFMKAYVPDPKLRIIMATMAESGRTIDHKVTTASCGGTACTNVFGDEQLAVDMLADKVLFEGLRHCGVCEIACSEENPVPLPMGGQGYSVCFDPLDGSSIVDTNFSVGTIFGVWPGDKIVGTTGRDLAASGIIVYGPRTVLCVAFKGVPGTFDFMLQDDGKWHLVKETTKIGEGKLFSPGNLRCTYDNPEYLNLISFYNNEQYTLRYTGGMVPDVYQLLIKGRGVFTNVTSPTTKAKLRLSFEVAPIALLIESAGGASSCDGKSVSALDVTITGIDQRTQVCFGSRTEVARFEQFMFGQVSPRLAATLSADELAKATAAPKSSKLITDAADPAPAFVPPVWKAQAVPEISAKIGESLEEVLAKAVPDLKLRRVMTTMANSCRIISHKVKTAATTGTAATNVFGDEQLAVDMVADKVLFEGLSHCEACEIACSEENPVPLEMGGSGYSVCFDPLDGSSIVDTNFAVGTIFGVWPGNKIIGSTGRDLAASGICVYGPRTVLCVAFKDYPGTHDFLLGDDGKWTYVKAYTHIGEGKLFAPGNLRCTLDNPEYERLISYYTRQQYTLRYTGGMVPDVYQILVKEKGVFTNVISPSTKAKLRLSFEAAPIALLVEKAGGASSCDGKCVSALDVQINGIDQRTQVCFGSRTEVARFEHYLYGKVSDRLLAA
uniref:Sedoheptulose-1,7-bisphosphatase, chloroplastic n=1 Tax=Euglena gracilis TaxID=3039 RepID=A3QSS1_EUGGR|nr:chloroplast sedoheptulose-1,7-bisphosphatase [Euglena gracilis]